MRPELVNRVVAAATRGPAAGALVGVLERAMPWRRGVLAVLTYHRVDRPEARPDLMPSLISATPEAFADQVAAIAERYTPVSLAQVLDALGDPRRLPPRAVHVTFDDAYADFAEHAWPVLRDAGVPVTLFVPTGYPDAPNARFWWDRLWYAIATTTLPELPDPPGLPLLLGTPADRARAVAGLRSRIKALPHKAAMAEVDRLIDILAPEPTDLGPPAVLGWTELRRLAAEGVTLAGHTRTHPLLDRLSLDDAVTEIAAGRADLEREVGPTPAVLAYPSGAHGGEAVEAARRAGMVLAVTTERGGNDLRHTDPLLIRRINVGRRAGTPLVRGQLAWASGLDSRRR